MKNMKKRKSIELEILICENKSQKWRVWKIKNEYNWATSNNSRLRQPTSYQLSYATNQKGAKFSSIVNAFMEW